APALPNAASSNGSSPASTLPLGWRISKRSAISNAASPDWPHWPKGRIGTDARGGHDPGACARYIGAQVHWLLGYPEQALALGQGALELAEQISHPFSTAISLQYNAMLHLDRGEPEPALERLKATEALAAEQRL